MVTVGIVVPWGSGLNFFQHHIHVNVCVWFCACWRQIIDHFTPVPRLYQHIRCQGWPCLVGSLPALLQRMGQVSGPAQTRSISSQMSQAHTVLGRALRVHGYRTHGCLTRGFPTAPSNGRSFPPSLPPPALGVTGWLEYIHTCAVRKYICMCVLCVSVHVCVLTLVCVHVYICEIYVCVFVCVKMARVSP